MQQSRPNFFRMPRGSLLRSNLNSIFGNLAVEEALLARPMPNPVLFLWRNSATVTVGRHQNPWKECNLKLMDDSGVTLARRYSGGGAVYQDLGCTTFTVACEIDASTSVPRLIDRNFEMICGALEKLGIRAFRKGRNDVMVGDSKVSGSAYKQTSTRFVHHGTILVNTDMSSLGRFLTPSKLKLQSKGVSSVVSRVSNLSELVPSVNHEKVCDALTKEFCKTYDCKDEFPEIVDKIIQTDPVFIRHHDQLRDMHWRLGSTPHFSHTVETRIEGIGMFECHYDVEREKITKVRIFSDILLAELVDKLENALRGCEYKPSAVRASLNNDVCSIGSSEQEKQIVESFTEWIINEMF